MKIAVHPTTIGPSDYPVVLLRRGDWDDYGFRTTFQVTLFLKPNEAHELGGLKILHASQKGGPTPLPEGVFPALGPEYCSLAGRLEYYKDLYALGRDVYEPYLAAMRDVAGNPRIKAEFEDKPGYQASLLRYSGAESLIAEAAQYFAPVLIAPASNDDILVSFKTNLGGSSNVVCDFDFRPCNGLPTRTVALIGYNGSGKTVLLSNLAAAASPYAYKSLTDIIGRTAGSFIGSPPPFKTVIVISYSAFDTFVLPGQSVDERASLERGNAQLGGYVYCGLRERIDNREDDYRLKTAQEIEDGFVSAIQQISKLNRLQHFTSITEPLAQETSFRRAGLEPLFHYQPEPSLRLLFSNLSSGHKIVLKIVSELAANIEALEPTLVLIDEPETHLHPPLLAAVLKSINACLNSFNGFAVIATHSPIVLQELPSRSVQILRRGAEASVQKPSIETFGEDLGVITQDVFNLDDTGTDWHDTLKALAETRTLEDIEQALGRRLGLAARSYVVSVREERGE